VDTAFGIPEGDRFEEYRQEIISVHPKVAEVSRASHIWGYFMDMHDPGETFGPLMAEGQDDQECLLASYLELGALVCVHPVTARIMTTHGDFHHGNILDAAGRQLLCVGFEGTCVSQALPDLAYHFCGNGAKGSGHNPSKLSFLAAYLRVLGEDPEALEPLLVECELASICFCGMDRHRTRGEVPHLIGLWRRFVAKVCGTAALQEELGRKAE